MAERPEITLFCEDRGHEQFVRSVVQRLAGEQSIRPVLRAINARGGEGRARAEFRTWQRTFLTGSGTPDLLVLVIDGNCHGWSATKSELDDDVDTTLIPRHVVGCPDPHIERWYMADPQTFRQVVGVAPGADPGKCERELYKQIVEEAVRRAQLPLLTGIADLAPDLVEAMDLYRAGKNQASLKSFFDDLRNALRQIDQAR